MSDWVAIQRWRCGCGQEWERKARVMELRDGRRVAEGGPAPCPKCGLEWRGELAKQRMAELDGQLAVWEEEEER